jgi:hypothetical protein
MTVTDVLPVYHHREHHSIWIGAPPDAALAAARETGPRTFRWCRCSSVSAGCARVATRRSGASMQARGFRLHDPETLTLIGRPWMPRRRFGR